MWRPWKCNRRLVSPCVFVTCLMMLVFDFIYQTYEVHSYADHHLKTFTCRVQLEGNPYEVIEAATEINVLCKSIPWTIWSNIERHAVNIIVSLPNPKQWEWEPTSNLFIMILYNIVIWELGTLNARRPIYCIKYNWKNRANPRHTLDRM